MGAPAHSRARNITATHPEDLAAELSLGSVSDAFDVIVGGPPCQAFARVGRPKLREIDAHPQAFRHDPRARLYLEYLRYVEAFQPLAIMMENVPDVLNHGGQNIAEEICEVLEQKGMSPLHAAERRLLRRAADARTMFLIGYRREFADRMSSSRHRRTGLICLRAMKARGRSRSNSVNGCATRRTTMSSHPKPPRAAARSYRRTGNRRSSAD